MASSLKDCTQCGKCCLKYPCLTAEPLDLLRWQIRERVDILNYASVIGDFADLWISEDTGEEMNRCPFLRKRHNQEIYDCQCYEDRPRACRGYPYYYKQMQRDHCEMIDKSEWIDK